MPPPLVTRRRPHPSAPMPPAPMVVVVVVGRGARPSVWMHPAGGGRPRRTCHPPRVGQQLYKGSRAPSQRHLPRLPPASLGHLPPLLLLLLFLLPGHLLLPLLVLLAPLPLVLLQPRSDHLPLPSLLPPLPMVGGAAAWRQRGGGMRQWVSSPPLPLLQLLPPLLLPLLLPLPSSSREEEERAGVVMQRGVMVGLGLPLLSGRPYPPPLLRHWPHHRHSPCCRPSHHQHL